MKSVWIGAILAVANLVVGCGNAHRECAFQQGSCFCSPDLRQAMTSLTVVAECTGQAIQEAVPTAATTECCANAEQDSCACWGLACGRGENGCQCWLADVVPGPRESTCTPEPGEHCCQHNELNLGSGGMLFPQVCACGMGECDPSFQTEVAKCSAFGLNCGSQAVPIDKCE